MKLGRVWVVAQRATLVHEGGHRFAGSGEDIGVAAATMLHPGEQGD